MSPSSSDAHAGDRGAATDVSKALASLRLSGLVSLLFLLLALIAAMHTPTTWPVWLTFRQVFLQDVWLAIALIATAGIAFFGSFLKLRRLEPSRLALALSALTIFVFCYAGHYLVLAGFDLTRDEQMVTFDAWIFGNGALVWPLPPEWQGEASALNLMFMLPNPHPVAWVSAYLPGNAMLHAAIGHLGDQALTAPLLTGLSLPLIWSIGRKLWPDDRPAAVIPAILLLTSGQVLLNGMTTYAMAAHLFFNLAWFRLFLANRTGADAAALMIGWFATGLHQPLFHPLFVAPFLLNLLLERRWGRLAIFALGYLAIGLFWLKWPEQMIGIVSGPAATIEATDGSDYVTRLREALEGNSSHIPLLGANLLRFMTWQNVALLPLVFAACSVLRRERIAVALALGLLLPIGVLSVILPWQGNGFGYRYVHPALGNALLLAGYGWRNLAPLHTRLRPAFAAASLATLLIMVPMWLTLSHTRYAPFARANAAIEASGADYLVLDRGRGVSYGSMVFNRPDLSNRPLRLAADSIRDPAALARLICKPGTTVAMATNTFFRPGAAYFGIAPFDTADARLPTLRAPYEAAGCRVVLLR